MWYAVEEYCNSCDVCQRYKVPQTGPKGLMTRRVVDRPWAVVAADMMEFPRSKNQNKYLLVFQDLFTRWIEIVQPLRKANGMERNTNEEQRRFVCRRCQGSNRKGLHRQSGRRWTSERGGGVESSERNASEEARAQQEAVAELNEYVRLMELGVPARLRPEPEGRAVVEVSGELIPVFARPSMHASEDAMDWEESVQPGNYSWQRPAWQQRTDADRRRASVSVDRPAALARASVLHRRARDVARTEEESRCWRRRHGQCWSSWWRPVNRLEEWDGEAFEEVFRGSPEEEVFVVGGGGGDGYASSLRTICAAVASTSSAGELRGGTAWLGVPAVRRATAAPATDGVSPRRATTTAPASPPGALPRAATTSSATSTATATTSARGSPRGGSTLSPVAGPSSLSGEHGRTGSHPRRKFWRPGAVPKRRFWARVCGKGHECRPCRHEWVRRNLPLFLSQSHIIRAHESWQVKTCRRFTKSRNARIFRCIKRTSLRCPGKIVVVDEDLNIDETKTRAHHGHDQDLHFLEKQAFKHQAKKSARYCPSVYFSPDEKFIVSLLGKICKSISEKLGKQKCLTKNFNEGRGRGRGRGRATGEARRRGRGARGGAGGRGRAGGAAAARGVRGRVGRGRGRGRAQLPPVQDDVIDDEQPVAEVDDFELHEDQAAVVREPVGGAAVEVLPLLQEPRAVPVQAAVVAVEPTVEENQAERDALLEDRLENFPPVRELPAPPVPVAAEVVEPSGTDGEQAERDALLEDRLENFPPVQELPVPPVPVAAVVVEPSGTNGEEAEQDALLVDFQDPQVPELETVPSHQVVVDDFPRIEDPQAQPENESQIPAQQEADQPGNEPKVSGREDRNLRRPREDVPDGERPSRHKRRRLHLKQKLHNDVAPVELNWNITNTVPFQSSFVGAALPFSLECDEISSAFRCNNSIKFTLPLDIETCNGVLPNLSRASIGTVRCFSSQILNSIFAVYSSVSTSQILCKQVYPFSSAIFGSPLVSEKTLPSLCYLWILPDAIVDCVKLPILCAARRGRQVQLCGRSELMCKV
ncbi:unnamed protein product, partial [Trichogramma brassicae]